MEANNTLIQKVFEFKEAVRKKNTRLAISLDKVLMPLLEYQKSLESASEQELLEIAWVNQTNAAYLLRIFSGEDIEAVAEDVPVEERIPRTRRRSSSSGERYHWDGSWDNAVGRYEDS